MHSRRKRLTASERASRKEEKLAKRNEYLRARSTRVVVVNGVTVTERGSYLPEPFGIGDAVIDVEAGQ